MFISYFIGISDTSDTRRRNIWIGSINSIRRTDNVRDTNMVDDYHNSQIERKIRGL